MFIILTVAIFGASSYFIQLALRVLYNSMIRLYHIYRCRIRVLNEFETYEYFYDINEYFIDDCKYYYYTLMYDDKIINDDIHLVIGKAR